MTDPTETNQKLLKEIAVLKKRIKELERSETERKRVEETLRQSELCFRTLFEENLDAIFWADSTTGMLTDCNRAAEWLVGRRREEILGRPFSTLHPPEELDRTMAAFSKFKDSGHQEPFVTWLLRPDGEQRWVSITGTFAHVHGQLIMQGTFRDITEYIHAEQLYRTLTEKSFAGVYIVQDGCFRFLNKNAASYAGYTVEELIGIASLKIIHPEDRETATKNVVDMIRGKSASPYEFRIITKEGNIRWIMETVTSINYEGKRAILGNSMDVTEIKQVKRKLEEQKALGASIMDAIPHAVVGLRNRRIVFANNAVEDVFGWKPEELVGQKTRALYRSGKDYAETGRIVYDALEKQRTYNLDVPLRRKDGREITCRLNTSVVGDNLTDGEIVVVFEDVTEQNRADEALRESQRHLSDIIEFLPDATFVIDRQGRVMAWNRAIEQMTGIKDEDILGKGDYEYALPFYGMRRPILIDLALEFDKEIEKKYSFVRKDGDGICAETDIILKGEHCALWGKASPLYDSKGCIVGAVESIRNITERKQSEEELRKYKEHLEDLVEERTNALRESEEKYRILVELSPDAIAVHSKGRLVYVNSAGIRLLGGVSSEEFIGRSALDFVHPDYREIAKERIRMIYESGKPAARMEEKFLRLDGQSIEVEVAAAPITYMGEPATQLVIVNITERKQAERELLRSNDLLRAIIEAAPTAIIGLDLDGNVHTVWNQAAEKMLGWSAQEVMGRLLPSVQTESQEEYRSFRERIRRGMTLDGVEVRRQRKDGTPIDYSIYASPLHDPEGRIAGNIAVLVDISERKKSEEERERLITELQKALSEVKQLSGLLPICSSCKKIRDDKGYWNQIESYIKDHSEAKFSHGICPECTKKLYPEFYEKHFKNKND